MSKQHLSRRILIVLLSLILICGALPWSMMDVYAETLSGSCGAKLTWSLDTATGALTIKGSGAMTDWDSFSATPWYKNRTSVTKVTIASGATTIGAHAFDFCTEMKSVSIPASVTSIGAYAFDDCRNLTGVTIPNSVTTIGEYAFSGCKLLASLTIPNSVTTIGKYAFSGCEKLASLTIPNSVTTIGSGAFYNCTNMTKVVLPNKLTTLDYNVFRGCAKLSTLTIPSSVTKINDNCFDGCTSLTKLTIPSGVTKLGWQVFKDCTGLASLTIPASVTDIGYGAFTGCTKMSKIDVASGNPNYVTGSKGELITKDQKTLMELPAPYKGNYTVPSTVTTIAFYAFEQCTGLSGVTVPNSVTEIRSAAFKNCTALTSVTLSNSLTSISSYLFEGCTALTGITIPSNVTSIGGDSFKNCTKLTSIGIPSKVTTIWSYAFNGCSKLSSVTISNGVQSIKDYAFYNCGQLTSIAIPSSVTEIGERAFGYYYSDAYNDWGNKKYSNFKIYGYPGFACETYAKENGFTFMAIDPKSGFGDVKTNAYYYKAMIWALEKGITSGTSSVTFSPNATCTRGQVVTFLWRSKGSPAAHTTTHPFTDVKTNGYYYKAMLWAVEKNVTSGMTKTTFGPNKGCTRAQVVTFLWRANGKPEPKSKTNPFNDIKPSDSYYKAVLWAVENGITSGATKTTFAPKKTCTRGQVVTFLYRAAGGK